MSYKIYGIHLKGGRNGFRNPFKIRVFRAIRGSRLPIQD